MLHYGLGDTATGVVDFDQMVTIARRLGDRGLEGIALSYWGFLEVYHHNFAQAEVTLRAAWDVLEEGYEQVRPILTLTHGHLLVASRGLTRHAGWVVSPRELCAAICQRCNRDDHVARWVRRLTRRLMINPLLEPLIESGG